MSIDSQSSIVKAKMREIYYPLYIYTLEILCTIVPIARDFVHVKKMFLKIPWEIFEWGGIFQTNLLSLLFKADNRNTDFHVSNLKNMGLTYKLPTPVSPP